MTRWRLHRVIALVPNNRCISPTIQFENSPDRFKLNNFPVKIEIDRSSSRRQPPQKNKINENHVESEPLQNRTIQLSKVAATFDPHCSWHCRTTAQSVIARGVSMRWANIYVVQTLRTRSSCRARLVTRFSQFPFELIDRTVAHIVFELMQNEIAPSSCVLPHHTR